LFINKQNKLIFKRLCKLKLKVKLKLKLIYKLTFKLIFKFIKQKLAANLINLSTKAKGLDLKNKKLT